MLRQKPWVWGKLGLKNILASRTSSAFPFLGLRPKCSKQNVYIQRDIYAFIYLSSFSNKENTTHSPGYFLLWTPLVLPCQVLWPTSCQSRNLSKSWHTQKSNCIKDLKDFAMSCSYSPVHAQMKVWSALGLRESWAPEYPPRFSCTGPSIPLPLPISSTWIDSAWVSQPAWTGNCSQ